MPYPMALLMVLATIEEAPFIFCPFVMYWGEMMNSEYWESEGRESRMTRTTPNEGQFHDQEDSVKKRISLTNSNLNHQICPEGGQPPGGR
jgi:hypothetical protein